MTPKSMARAATLAKIAADPRVEEVYSDSDGIWCNLKHGYKVEHEEVTSIRADSPEAMMEAFYHGARIVAGHTGGCCDLPCSEN